MLKSFNKKSKTCKVCNSIHIPHKKYNEYCYDHIPLDKRCIVIINNKRCKNPSLPGLTSCKTHRKCTNPSIMKVRKTPSKKGQECVYIVWLGKDDYYKIGKTVNMEKRLHSLRSANPWIEERYCELVRCNRVESKLHRMFKHQKLERETFRLSENDLRCAHEFMLTFVMDSSILQSLTNF